MPDNFEDSVDLILHFFEDSIVVLRPKRIQNLRFINNLRVTNPKMAKRARGTDGKFVSGGSVTGGSGDVKPQWLTAFTNPPIAGSDYTVTEVLVPRLVLGSVNTATVMEILRVDYYMGITNLADATTINFAFLNTRILHQTDDPVTLNTINSDTIDPGTFAFVLYQTERLLTVASESVYQNKMPAKFDMTDNNGNGVLVATDKFFLTSGNFGNGTVTGATAKILYRMVNVGIREYVGIVASQMG